MKDPRHGERGPFETKFDNSGNNNHFPHYTTDVVERQNMINKERFLKLLDMAIEMSKITEERHIAYPFVTVYFSGGQYSCRLFHNEIDIDLFSTMQIDIYKPFHMAVDAVEKALNELKGV